MTTKTKNLLARRFVNDGTQSEVPSRFAHSARLFEEAMKFAPGGVHSNVRLSMKPFPLFFRKAKGCHLWDVDNNEYIDYALGMGPVILGHANPEVNQQVLASLGEGQLYAGQHAQELKLAQTICEIVPCSQMVRFSLSGSEAVQAAMRLARAATGREAILKFEGHYHGWFDNIDVSVHPDEAQMGPLLRPATVPMSLGQDADAYRCIRVLPWNDLEVAADFLDAHGPEIAAVLMEPIMCNTSVILPHSGFLEKVREHCTKRGIILIFDEVITGFRVGLGGAQEFLGIQPDLAIFAKALANGYPISCLAGSRDLMRLFSEGGVVHAGTFNGNRIGCAAALATLSVLRRNSAEVYAHIRKVGSLLMNGLKKLGTEMREPLLVQGLPSVFHTTFANQREITDYRSYSRCRLDLQAKFVWLLLERGVRIADRGTWFLCAAHTERDIELTLKAARDAVRALATG